jgi:hypothetical protein
MANGETAVRAGWRDSGLLALVSLLRFLGKPADPANLKHQFSPDGENFTADHILREAKSPEVKARGKRRAGVRPGGDFGVRDRARRLTILDAFAFTRYGTVSGQVVDISRDANKDDKLGLSYPVRVRPDAADINVEGKRVAFAPGMAVSAEIITGGRRVIEYVLSPVLRYRHESGREG